MADLGKLTKSIGSKIGSATATVGKAAGGVVSSVVGGTYNTVASGFKKATDIGALSPRNIAAETLDAAGLGAIMPALMRDPRKDESVQAAQKVADQNKSSAVIIKPLEELINKLLLINEKILDANQQLIKYAKLQSNSLDTSNDLVKKQMLLDIEREREAKKVSGTPAVVGKEGEKKDAKGGFLSGILDSASNLLKFLGPIGEFIGSIGRILGFVGRLVLSLNPLVLVALGALASLKTEDFAKFFENIGKVFSDLAEGKFLDAIVRFIFTIQDIILKGIGRLVANILEFFGFDGVAKAINDFLDNFNLADFMVDMLHKVIDAIKNIGPIIDSAINEVKKFFGSIYDSIVSGINAIYDFFAGIPDAVAKAFKAVGDFFSSIGKAITDAIDAVWNFFKGIGDAVSKAIDTVGDFFKAIGQSILDAGSSVMNFFGSVKDWIVKKFTDAADTFSQWWDNFHPLDSVLGFFTSVKDWVTKKFTDAVDTFSQWWDSFNIIDIVLTPFNYIKDTAVALFDNLQKAVSDVLGFDLVGKISDTIGNVISGVWNFFKELPSKAVDLISDFLPDSLKNFFKSMFGGGSSNQGTPARSAALPSNTPTQTANQSIADNSALINGQPQQLAMASPSGRDEVFNQQSARMTVDQNAPAPVIINNSTNTSGGGAPVGNSPPRTSGAVQTSPASSHLDRALYGDYYGSGVA